MAKHKEKVETVEEHEQVLNRQHEVVTLMKDADVKTDQVTLAALNALCAHMCLYLNVNPLSVVHHFIAEYESLEDTQNKEVQDVLLKDFLARFTGKLN